VVPILFKRDCLVGSLLRHSNGWGPRKQVPRIDATKIDLVSTVFKGDVGCLKDFIKDV